MVRNLAEAVAEPIEMDLDAIVALSIITVLGAIAIYEFAERRKEIAERHRIVNQQFSEKEEARERRRAYLESYQRQVAANKKRLLDNLIAITRGTKSRIDAEALKAANDLREREGDPTTQEGWALIIKDLQAPIVNVPSLRDRINDLLYPETLEDIDELKRKPLNSYQEKDREKIIARSHWKRLRPLGRFKCFTQRRYGKKTKRRRANEQERKPATKLIEMR